MAIPSRVLEEINAKELKASDFYSIYGEDSVKQALDELNESNVQILNSYKTDDMKAAVAAKLSGKNIENTKKTVKTGFKIYRIASFAAAAIFIAAIALPVSLNTNKSKTPQATERTKGPARSDNTETSLHIYRQKGREIQSLENETFAKQGDVLQITYTAGNSEYGVIFSVDGNGNITRHFPGNSWTAEALKHGNEEIPLDFSYELDDAPDFECFIMVTSNQQFELNDLSKKIKNPKDINYLKKADFIPKKSNAVSFVIEK